MTDPDAPNPGRRRWVWVSALVLLLVAGGVAWRILRRPSPMQYQTAAVTRGPVVAKVTTTGIVSAVVTVQVGSQVSGRIATLHADYNSTVKKNELHRGDRPRALPGQPRAGEGQRAPGRGPAEAGPGERPRVAADLRPRQAAPGEQPHRPGGCGHRRDHPRGGQGAVLAAQGTWPRPGPSCTRRR